MVLNDARHLVRGRRDAVGARAESIAVEIEPELTLAVDGTFSERAPDGEPQGSERGLSLLLSVNALHRASRRRRAAPDRRRRAGSPSIPSSGTAWAAPISRAEFLAAYPAGRPSSPPPTPGGAEPGPLDCDSLCCRMCSWC